MSEQLTWNDGLERGDDGEETWPALVLVNMALSVVASSLLIIRCHRHLGLAALGLLLAVDSLLNQGLPIFLQRGAALSCFFLASSSLFFLILIVSFMASLSALYTPCIPQYFYLLVPPVVAFCNTTPFGFPQAAVSKYFHSRQNCGFISLSYVLSSFTFIFGFVFPFCTLYYFSARIYFPFYDRSVIRNKKPVMIFISLCSVLLIPHIVLINITHFSVSLVNANLDHKVMSSNVYETIFIWLRYGFNVITPIVIMYTVADDTNEWKHLYYLCYHGQSVTKYLKKKTKFQLISAQKHTPILFLANEDLMLSINNNIKYMDIPYNCEALKGDSSISTELSSTSHEKNTTRKKKIVRFANTVKEITMKTNEWDTNSDSN